MNFKNFTKKQIIEWFKDIVQKLADKSIYNETVKIVKENIIDDKLTLKSFYKEFKDFVTEQREFNKQQLEFNQQVRDFMKMQLEFNKMILQEIKAIKACPTIKKELSILKK